jgi:RNA polymerase sigma factor (TIGR02999 family)
MSDVTRLINDVQTAQPRTDELLPLVYDELRRLAAAKMAHEVPGQTLQPTALVHEAWLRLGGEAPNTWQNRNHFLAAAAEAMRRILIEKARRKARLRRGGKQERLDLEALESLDLVTHATDESLLGLDEALRQLEAEEPDAAQVVSLRFFAGLNMAQIADLQGVSERTVKRTWAFARAWLYDRLRSGA